jgi:general secretion pathway protein A
LYLQFFGLNEAPFSITPDPAFVYLSAAHRDALAHLHYGVGQGGSGGFVQLTGEVGTGKTTLCRCLLEQVPENTRVALVLNPLMTPGELLATICEELGIETAGISGSNKALVDALNQYLLAQHAAGKRVVVVIDEAQNLSPEALEQVRLLTNLETAKDKLLQMVLLGQPELRELLQRQSLRQLSQRITARYHLAPLNEQETHGYIRHRMQVAGAQKNPFRRSAMRALFKRSAGIPRLINIIADRALTGAYAAESGSVSARLVHSAANEVQPSEKQVRANRWPMVIATSSILLLLAITFWSLDLQRLGSLRFEQAARGEPVAGVSAPAQNESDNQGQAVQGKRSAARELPVGSLPALPAPVEQAEATLEPGWLEQQHRLAWRSMAGLWQDNDSALSIQSACDGDTGTGYACLTDQGNWSRIRQLGLPVILVLKDQENRLLLLRGFTDEGLLVGSGDDMLEVSRDAIEENWFGEYLVAWPQAPDWPVQIRRGESGAAVDIVMEMAGFAEPPWTGGGVFDAGFESWLIAFQRRNGLKADGIIGPNTLIYLMAPTINQPRLVLAREENS